MTELQARILLDPQHAIGTVDPRVFGSFVEHMGRCVYDGIYEPDHPSADGDGFRGDVADRVRELGVPIVRYPGGNFVSGYRWEDGVGPAEERPVRLDPAWRSTETNRVGLDEFATWCRTVDTEPMLAVNLGTRGVDAARSLVEYANHPGGSAWSDLRIRHGAAQPYAVRTWCLGNEMDGPWQIGHKTAEEYGRLATETAKAMKWVDDSIELVACGSSGSGMPTFPEWDRTVLEHAYDHVEYLSLHQYIGLREGDVGSYLASGARTDAYIDAVIATCDYVKATKRSTRPMYLSFDEWNVAPSTQQSLEGDRPGPWRVAPPIAEGSYDARDAVAFGGMMLSLIRHADRVRIGCLAQLVNVLGPIKTRTGGPAWAETIFYPYLHGSRWGRGTALRVVADSPPVPAGDLGDVPALDVAAVQGSDGTLTVFGINRSPDELDLVADLRPYGSVELLECHTLSDTDPLARNSPEDPERVIPRDLAATVDGGTVSARLPGTSWNVLRFGVPEA